MNDDKVPVGKIVGFGLLALVVILGLTWIGQGNDFFMYKVFAPATAKVQRQVFENTPSYNQGMIQELQNMQFQYEQVDSAHKDALRSIILHRVAGYGEAKLPPDFQAFVDKLKRDQMGIH